MRKSIPVLAVNNDESSYPRTGGSRMKHSSDRQLDRATIPANAEAPINILIVDDEPKNLSVLEAVLDNPAYRLVRAESAEQALLALLGEEFALLILDIRMPGVTGFELAQLVKDRKKTAQVPIIFLTAYYNEDQHVIEGYGTGAIDYLHKPINPPVLRAKVAVFAELHRKQREAEAANAALIAEVSSRRRAEDQLRQLNNTLEEQISERTDHIRLLMNEVNHRSKNILALVMVIAQQTAARQPTDFLQSFSKRIQALAANQDLLVKNQWQSIEVGELIRAQLTPFEDIVGKKILLVGAQILLKAKASQSIGMALHELATNAAKYGALSSENGHVAIDWQLKENSNKQWRFILSWSETGGPPVSEPVHRGFGMRVIKNMIEMNLDAHVVLDYKASGLVWQLDCPVAKIVEEASLQ